MSLGEKQPQSDTLVVNGASQKALRIVFRIKGTTPAYKKTYTRAGKQKTAVVPVTMEHLEYLRKHGYLYEFGMDEVDGEATVTINMTELFHLAMAASRNTNKTSKRGVAVAKFNGNRIFYTGA